MIYFTFSISWELGNPDRKKAALKKILEALEKNPFIAVNIEGHTDSDGYAHNLDFPKRSAGAVVCWLAGRKMDAARLEASGKGESTPIADSTSAVGAKILAFLPLPLPVVAGMIFFGLVRQKMAERLQEQTAPATLAPTAGS